IGKSGIYNYTDEGVCSWYDFTVAIATFSGHDTCRINPCLSLNFPTKAVRPAYSVLDKSSVKETFGVSIRHWAFELKDYMEAEGLV
ncbi:MAG: sugar nucleotide-binding protein, partial [Candidatus Cryptobacteroides sp.]